VLATDNGGSPIGNGNCSLLSNAHGNAALTDLAAGTYYIRVFTSSYPYQWPYQLNVKLNGVGATASLLSATNGHGLILSAESGLATGLRGLPLSAMGQLAAPTIDALGHMTFGTQLSSGTNLGSGAVTQNGYYVSTLNAEGVGLWNQQLPLYNSSPIVAAGPDGAIYFAGNIYNTQMINGTSVGTAGGYEVVWGKLAQ
jgi:hypothetical protein